MSDLILADLVAKRLKASKGCYDTKLPFGFDPGYRMSPSDVASGYLLNSAQDHLDIDLECGTNYLVYEAGSLVNFSELPEFNKLDGPYLSIIDAGLVWPNHHGARSISPNALIGIGRTPYRQVPDYINRAIESFKYILDYKEGWDGEDALPVNRLSWARGIHFLTQYIAHISSEHGILINLPEINPCRDGSIDLSWHTEKAHLLINFLPSQNYETHYYGDDGNDNVIIKGILNTEQLNEDIAFWMRKLKK